ncbi:MAG: acetyl-CoA C-acetyltransferase [Clostridia bacterium]|nr:acetyl-CoA C-acetyltransferase [Clostridia bacterium]
MPRPVIVAAARTAIGDLGGSLAQVPAVELGRIVIEAVLKRAGINANAVDEVIMGNVLQAGQGINPARQAAMAAGTPAGVPSFTINKV